MANTLSARELAARTGATIGEIAVWHGSGLLAAVEADRFPPDAVDRVRLLRRFLRRSIPLDAVAAWAATGEMDRHLAMIAPPSQGAYTVEEAAAQTGLPEPLVRIFTDVIDLEGPGARLLDDEDLEALRCLQPAVAAGLPEDAVIELARVFSDAMRRVAETEAHLFHFHVRRALGEQGLSGEAIDAAVWKASERLEPLDEPALLYFHRRALRHAIADMAAIEVAERAGLQVPGTGQEVRVAVAFVDLASFTPLTEAMGDEQAASVLTRFAAIVRRATRDGDGHVVKQIGDAFMLVFPGARHAVPAILAIEQRCAAEEHFPAIRGGINAGPVLFQAGEYLGATVNLAARLAAAAERHQVLVGADVRREAADTPGVAFRPVGARRLKGITEPVEVWDATSTTAGTRARLVDPVCGMELSPEEVSVRLLSDAGDVAFCSQACLRRYVARSESA